MIKVKLTENYTGFNIEGTFDDFYELYDNIDSFLPIEESNNFLEEEMRLHVLGFLYDLRHAYQGARYVKAVDNGLSDDQKEWCGIKKSVKQDILYSFDYVVPELILDILIFKHFAYKDKKIISEYDVNYNSVMTFYSEVIDSLSLIVTEAQLKKIKRLLSDSNISKKYFLRQWFENISKKYINMTKKKRQKEIMHVIDSTCNWYNYDEYDLIKKSVEKCAKEHNVPVTEIEYGEKYPREIKW